MDHTRSCRGSEDDQPRAESSNHLRTTTSSWGSFAVGILDPRFHGASSPQKPQVNSTPHYNNRSGSRCSSPAVASYAAKISSPNLLMCNLLILGLLLAFHDSVLHPVQASSSSTSSQQLRVVDQERDSRTIQQSVRRHEISWSRSLHLQQLPPDSISPVTELLDTASMHNSRRGAPSMRVLLQSNTGSSSTKNFRPLAAKSDRVDPLNHLRKYRDGFDLKNKHYWASVIFTGIYGYAIAVAWAILGLVLSLIACCKCLCARRRRTKNPRNAAIYWIPRFVVCILSAIAIGCVVILYIVSKECKTEAYDVEDVILEAAQNATDSIHTVSSKLASVQVILQPYYGIMSSVNTIEVTLNRTANDVQSKVLTNKETYKHVVQIIWIVLLVIISVTLFLITCGLASTFLRWRRFFYLIIVLAWIMTTLTWLSFGIFFAAHNVLSDTCLSLQEYLQDPANTTLDTVLPCAALAADNQTYLTTRQGMDNLIKQENQTFMAYAGNITSLTGLCDPIGPAPDYAYTGICPNNTLPLGDLQEVIAPLVCNTTGSACTSSGKLISEQQNASFTDLSQGKLMHSPKSPPIFGSRKFLLLQDYPLQINVTSATKSKDG
jgi:ABC-type sugar transport system permease subunit